MQIPSPLLQSAQASSKSKFNFKPMHILLAMSLALNGYLLFFKQTLPSSQVASVPSANAQAASPMIEDSSSGPEDITAEENAQEEIAISAAKTVALKSTGEKVLGAKIQTVSFASSPQAEAKNLRTLQVTIRQSLNQTLCQVLTEQEGCLQLSAYIGRLLVWFVDLNKEVRNGDAISVVYEPLNGGEDQFQIIKLKYQSGYHQKTFEANYYQIPGTRYGGFFNREGREIHPSIADREAPIRDYIEITSLPGDYRAGRFHGHRGTDFKASPGTPIHAAFDGKVLRRNWNTRANGYSLEIEHPGHGVITRYLHLSRSSVKPGDAVRQGQQIAESGNTGRSYAPHLHYEIEALDGKKNLLNPFDTTKHKTYYRQVPDPRKEEYLQLVSRYDSLIPQG